MYLKTAFTKQGPVVSLLTGVVLVALVGCSSSESTPVIDTADNCVGIDNPDQVDTDSDGLGDACDSDDDGDGFQDDDDPAPLDNTRPGNFATPEAILDDPTVKTALADAEAVGAAVAAEKGLAPPSISGYYTRPSGVGTVVATSNNTDIGRTLVGGETRIEQGADNAISFAGVAFTRSMPVSFSIAEGSIIRGEGNRFSIYSRNKQTCTESGSDYSTFGISISSGEVDLATGNIVNARGIGVVIDVEGQLTQACADRSAGETELVGGWSAQQLATRVNVEPSELLYMCVDDDAAYAPTETWTSSDAMACTCTTDYQISCQ